MFGLVGGVGGWEGGGEVVDWMRSSVLPSPTGSQTILLMIMIAIIVAPGLKSKKEANHKRTNEPLSHVIIIEQKIAQPAMVYTSSNIHPLFVLPPNFRFPGTPCFRRCTVIVYARCYATNLPNPSQTSQLVYLLASVQLDMVDLSTS